MNGRSTSFVPAQVFEYVVRLTDVIVLEGINSADKLDVIAKTLVESVREIMTLVLSDKQVLAVIRSHSQDSRLARR
jgi:hypothetical protein